MMLPFLISTLIVLGVLAGCWRLAAQMDADADAMREDLRASCGPGQQDKRW